ncbi:MAG: DUF3021 family protein [Clostridia bacterium]|nr:DUF3021 family protein [Clostridia bacterium]
MDKLKKLKKILSDACVYFTAAEFLVLFIATGYSEISPETGGTAGKFLSLQSAALILLACVLMSALNIIFRMDLSTMLKVLFHFIGSMLAYSLVFIVIPGAWTDFGAIFVRLGVFVVLYLVIAFVVLVINSILNNKRTEDLEYESQFSEFFRSDIKRNGNKK